MHATFTCRQSDDFHDQHRLAMMSNLGRLIGDYGYLIVGLFIFAEGLCLPFPTDTTLVTAAAFAATGRLSITVLFLVSTVTTTLGTSLAFVAGRRGGDFFEKHSRRVNPAVLARTRGFFDRHGTTAVLVGRFVPVARMLISPLAGLSSMSLARFTVFNVAGAALWSAVFCGVGYFFGQHPPKLGGGLVRATLIIAVGLAVIVTVAVAGRERHCGFHLSNENVARHPQPLRGHHRHLPLLHGPDAQEEGAVADRGDQRERGHRQDDLQQSESAPSRH